MSSHDSNPATSNPTESVVTDPFAVIDEYCAHLVAFEDRITQFEGLQFVVVYSNQLTLDYVAANPEVREFLYRAMTELDANELLGSISSEAAMLDVAKVTLPKAGRFYLVRQSVHQVGKLSLDLGLPTWFNDYMSSHDSNPATELPAKYLRERVLFNKGRRIWAPLPPIPSNPTEFTLKLGRELWVDLIGE